MSKRSEDASPKKDASAQESDKIAEQARIDEEPVQSQHDQQMDEVQRTENKESSQQKSEKELLGKTLTKEDCQSDADQSGWSNDQPLKFEDIEETNSQIIRRIVKAFQLSRKAIQEQWQGEDEIFMEPHSEEELRENDKNQNEMIKRIMNAFIESRRAHLSDLTDSEEDLLQEEPTFNLKALDSDDNDGIAGLIQGMETGDPNEELERSFDETRVETVRTLMELLSYVQKSEVDRIETFLRKRPAGLILNQRLQSQVQEHVTERRDRIITRVQNQVTEHQNLSDREKEDIYQTSFIQFLQQLLSVVEVVIKGLRKLNFGQSELRVVFKKKMDPITGEMVDHVIKLFPVSTTEFSTGPESSASESHHGSAELISIASGSLHGSAERLSGDSEADKYANNRTLMVSRNGDDHIDQISGTSFYFFHINVAYIFVYCQQEINFMKFPTFLIS